MSGIWLVVGDTWTLISVTELVIRSDYHDDNQPPLCAEHGVVLPRVHQQDQDQVQGENVWAHWLHLVVGIWQPKQLTDLDFTKFMLKWNVSSYFFICLLIMIDWLRQWIEKIKFRGNARPRPQIRFPIGFMRCSTSQVFRSIVSCLIWPIWP